MKCFLVSERIHIHIFYLSGYITAVTMTSWVEIHWTLCCMSQPHLP